MRHKPECGKKGVWIWGGCNKDRGREKKVNRSVFFFHSSQCCFLTAVKFWSKKKKDERNCSEKLITEKTSKRFKYY